MKQEINVEQKVSGMKVKPSSETLQMKGQISETRKWFYCPTLISLPLFSHPLRLIIHGKSFQLRSVTQTAQKLQWGRLSDAMQDRLKQDSLHSHKQSSWVHVPIGQSAVITLLLSLTAKSHPGSITVCPVEPLDGRPQRCLLGLVLFLSPLTALLIVQSAEWIDQGQGHIPSMHWLRGVQTGCWGITVWACHTKHCTFWHFNLSPQHRITVGIV